MEPFTADTPFQCRMAEGHLTRTGHALTGHWEGQGFERHLVRECC